MADVQKIVMFQRFQWNVYILKRKYRYRVRVWVTFESRYCWIWVDRLVIWNGYKTNKRRYSKTKSQEEHTKKEYCKISCAKHSIFSDDFSSILHENVEMVRIAHNFAPRQFTGDCNFTVAISSCTIDISNLRRRNIESKNSNKRNTKLIFQRSKRWCRFFL